MEKKKRKKLLVFLPNLGIGGGELFAIRLISLLDPLLWDIKVVVLNRGKQEIAPALLQGISIIDLHVSRVRFSLIAIIKVLLKEKADIVFSNISHLNVMLAMIIPLFHLLYPRMKFLARESSLASRTNAELNKKKWMDIPYRLFYPFFDQIICQSIGMAEDLSSFYAITDKKITIINNFIPPMVTLPREEDSLLFPGTEKSVHLVTVGRLSYVKRIDLLLKVMHFLRDEDFYLHIVGDGEEKSSLINICKELKIEENVIFWGMLDYPQQVLTKSHCYLCSSAFEGFPNAVLEALTFGLPVFAFDCPGGLVDIIQHGKNGLIFSRNPEEMAQAISERKYLSFMREGIIDDVKKRFAPLEIAGQYNNLFQRVLES